MSGDSWGRSTEIRVSEEVECTSSDAYIALFLLVHYIQCMDMFEIGAAIRAARAQRKLNQEQVGKMLGMSRATISGIETGKVVEVGVRKLMALCAVVGLDVSVGVRRPYPTLQELRSEVHDQKRG